MSDITPTDIVLDRLHHTFCTYPTAFRSALEVIGHSPLPAIEFSRAMLENHETAMEHYSDFLRELAYQPPHEELGVLLRAIYRAMAIFSLRDCRVPTREEVLVGLFRGAVADSLSCYNRALKRSGQKRQESRLYTVDLNVAGREGRTGGDIAFIFDVVMPVGARAIVPICLQAKKAAPAEGSKVDISRTNGSDSVGEHQLKQLEKFEAAGCNCAYLFFNNHLRTVVNEPVLPLVKTTIDIRNGTSALEVDLGSNTIDFSSYVLHLLSRREKAVGGVSELEKIVATLAEGKISHLVLISSDPNAWRSILSFMRRQKGHYLEPNLHLAGRGSVDFASAMSERNSFAPRAEDSTYSYARRVR